MSPGRLLIVALVSFAWQVRAISADYLRDVKPLLKEHCYACHGALKQKGKLRLDTAAALRAGGEDGPLAAKGIRAEQSALIQRVSTSDMSERMPPEGNGLTGDQVNVLRNWIDQGAPGPAAEKAESDPRKHWAFQRVESPAVPIVKDRNVRNPIDAFLASTREAKGTSPLPEADKATLLRRVYLDLIGLPPTRPQLRAFLADESPNAYESVVDRLLSSPQYGERWGRHWMDVWRYSDWYGRRAVPDVMNSYPTIWRWRDWIVRSLNEDKGYDRMVTEMLAADEIDPGDDANVVATGFIVRNWFKWNYNQWMRDQVEHTGKAFLGLTMNCCHCHDHKYDPITKEEYFKFRAFFEPLELRQDRVAGEPDPGAFVKYVYGAAYGPIPGGMIRVFDEKLDAQTIMYIKGDERNVVAGKPAVPPGVPAAFGGPMETVKEVTLPPVAWYPGLRPFVRAEERTAKRTALANAVTEWITKPKTQVSWMKLNVAALTLNALEARIAADDAKYPDPDSIDPIAQPNADTLARAAVKAEHQANFAAAKMNRLAAPPPQVPAADKAIADAKAALAKDGDQYTPLSPVYPTKSTGRRTALAKWITSRDNPLAARVAVNHIWLRHFGVAIVPSTFDFGRNGKPPTNQPLLDWMAAELMDSGWKMKQLHRLIVTSEAYRMASAVPGQVSANAATDPDNITLWHFNAKRMEAEVVRDSVIAISGDLDARIGGADIDMKLGQAVNRRSIYFTHHGEEKMKILELFDVAEPTDCYRRTETIVPQQALVLANSDLTLRCAREAAKKIWQGATGNEREKAFVASAFEQVLTRDPSPAEQATCLRFLMNQTQIAQSPERAREDLVHALLNHNDFVSVR